MPSREIQPQTEEELKQAIDPARLPRHVAVIMDGNGRWAKSRFLSRVEGHRQGINSVRDIVEIAAEIKIPVLTLYAFSVENWFRPKDEVSTLMKLLVEYLRKELDRMLKNDIRLISIGDEAGLPLHVQEELRYTIQRTARNEGMILNLALNYSGHQEIIMATKKIARDLQAGNIREEDLDEKLFSRYLFTRGLPDPDLLIRTSGEMRLSNFLLWQLAYAEFWITPTLWPDFRRNEFLQAIISYQGRERRFGRVKEE
ncbi:MAG: isoprenyl transferase [bacterium]